MDGRVVVMMVMMRHARGYGRMGIVLMIIMIVVMDNGGIQEFEIYSGSYD